MVSKYIRYPIDTQLATEGNTLKQDFEEWASKNLRTRKPTKAELADCYADSLEQYAKKVPLIKDADPILFEKIITHFNAQIDMFVQHYSKPKFLRTLVTDTALHQKSSAVLNKAMAEIEAHLEERMASDAAPPIELRPIDITSTLYVEACDRFESATGHKPMRPKGDISITKTKPAETPYR